ncbi:MAG: hypothetical protein WCK98_00400 [bacterium]
MLEINNSLDKKELLYTLAKIANEPGTLYIKVHSLPTFLTTPIAFTIFNYQISNYPRNITWTSENFQILNFLKNCNAQVADPDTNFDKNRYNDAPEPATFLNWEHEAVDIKQPLNEIIEIETEDNSLSPIQVNKSVVSVTIGDKKPLIGGVEAGEHKQSIKARNLLEDSGYEPSSLINIQNSKLQPTASSESEDQIFLHRGGDAFDFSMQSALIASKTISQKPNQTSQQLQAEQKAHKTNLYETWPKQSKDQEKVVPAFEPVKYEQNLDELLSRIEATRDALSSLKMPQQKTVAVNSGNGIFWKTFGFLSTSAIVSAVVVGFLFFFPTKAYSLDITPETKVQTDTVSFSKEEFTNRKVPIQNQDSVVATGKETQTQDRATGTITLVNNSSGQIKFDKGGIILVGSSGLEYRQVGQNNEPGTFVVPGQSSNITITITATGNGTDYNLPINSTLKIYNLKKDALGSSFNGVVATPVNVTKQTGNSIVIQDDINNLQTKAESSLEKLAKQEVSKLSQENVITKENWYEILNPSYNFSHKVGQITSTLTVDSGSNVGLYYLDESVLVTKLKLTNTNIQRVIEVTKVDSSDKSIVGNSKISLKIDYKYTIKQQFNEASIAQKLSGNSFSTAKDQLQQEYPTINDIQEKKSGLNLPGLNPRVEVKVNINDQDLK